MAEALLAQERHDYEQKLRDMELAQLQDLMRGPALSVQSGGGSVGGGGSAGSAVGGAAGRAGTSRAYSGEWGSGEEGLYEAESHWQDGDAGGSISVPIAPQDSSPKVSSFATITQVPTHAVAAAFRCHSNSNPAFSQYHRWEGTSPRWARPPARGPLLVGHGQYGARQRQSPDPIFL
jgi:hypothetical protein